MNDLLECANCFSSCKECVLTPSNMDEPERYVNNYWHEGMEVVKIEHYKNAWEYVDEIGAENKALRELGIELKHSIYAYLSDSDLKELNEKADKLLNNK